MRKYKKVFLDIDGVFNALGVLDNPVIVPHDWGIWAIDKENITFLKTLSGLPGVQVIWISSWQEESNQLNDALHIPHFPFFYLSNKHETLEHCYADKSRIIIDDEVNPYYPHVYKPSSLTGLQENERLKILHDITS